MLATRYALTTYVYRQVACLIDRNRIFGLVGLTRRCCHWFTPAARISLHRFRDGRSESKTLLARLYSHVLE